MEGSLGGEMRQALGRYRVLSLNAQHCCEFCQSLLKPCPTPPLTPLRKRQHSLSDTGAQKLWGRTEHHCCGGIEPWPQALPTPRGTAPTVTAWLYPQIGGTWAVAELIFLYPFSWALSPLGKAETTWRHGNIDRQVAGSGSLG